MKEIRFLKQKSSRKIQKLFLSLSILFNSLSLSILQHPNVPITAIHFVAAFYCDIISDALSYMLLIVQLCVMVFFYND